MRHKLEKKTDEKSWWQHASLRALLAATFIEVVAVLFAGMDAFLMLLLIWSEAFIVYLLLFLICVALFLREISCRILGFKDKILFPIHYSNTHPYISGSIILGLFFIFSLVPILMLNIQGLYLLSMHYQDSIVRIDNVLYDLFMSAAINLWNAVSFKSISCSIKSHSPRVPFVTGLCF